MNYLYAPWRSGYFIGKNQECVFCAISKGAHSCEKVESRQNWIPKEENAREKDSTDLCHQNLTASDIENRVFYRDEKVFCVMNKFPYTPRTFSNYSSCAYAFTRAFGYGNLVAFAKDCS